MALPLNCLLLCASGAAYDIALDTGIYTADPIFSKAVAYAYPPPPNPTAIAHTFLKKVVANPSTPAAISTDVQEINACLVGQTAVGIIVAFRGTVPTSWLDWLQDAIVEPISVPPLPGLVHAGFTLGRTIPASGHHHSCASLESGPFQPGLRHRA